MSAMLEASCDASHSARNSLASALLLVAMLVLGSFMLAATTDISGAVVSRGTVIAGQGVTSVKHPTGGIVKQILTHEGDTVGAGEVILLLDDTQTKANLAIITNSLQEMQVRLSRLDAELRGNRFITDISQSALSNAALETDIFELRRASALRQKAQLTERIGQFERQIDGLNAAAVAKHTELEWTDRELVAVRTSYERQMVELFRLTQLERAIAQQQGELGGLQASIAEAEGRIAEIKLQLLEVDDAMRTDVANQLLETNSRISELQERQLTAQDQLDRMAIRAPISGTINQMAVKAPGAVVGASEPIVTLVPSADTLHVEARIAPGDIDQISLGQPSMVKFSAFNQRTTPEIKGAISFVAPDLSINPDGQTSSYLVRITISPQSLEPLQNLAIVPGMPADVFIQTSERTLLSYVTRPLVEQIGYAFRE